MSKNTWYIWISLPAFFILWMNSLIKILSANKKVIDYINKPDTVNLWFSFMGQTFVSIVALFMFPVIIMGVFFGIITQQFPNIEFILEIGQLIILYLLGVYIAYKHVLWRKKNII